MFKRCTFFPFRLFVVQGQVSQNGCCFPQLTWGWHHYSVPDRRPTIVESALQKLLGSSDCIGDQGVGVSAPQSEAELHRERDLCEWAPLKRNKGSSLPVCFGSCLIDLSTYEWMHRPSFPVIRTMALKACINWPCVIPTEWRALRRVWVISSLNLLH